MIVVADTTPINYLILIRHINVLPALYQRIIVPEAVVDEMSRNASPAQVRTWVEHPPDWLEIRSDPAPDPTLNFLDFGERAAISLAELVGADKLLLDEWAGRTEAERRHLSVTGTLGVVADAHIHGLLDFDTALSRLRATNFRLAAEVERFVRLKLSTRIAKSIRDGEDAQ